MPLFAWIEPAPVRSRIVDTRGKPLPTSHYRLPDAYLGEVGWCLTLEWNRWCVVEQRAEKRAMLNKVGDDYRRNAAKLLPVNWAIKASEWLVTS